MCASRMRLPQAWLSDASSLYLMGQSGQDCQPIAIARPSLEGRQLLQSWHMDYNLLTSPSEGWQPAPFPSACPALQNRYVVMNGDRCSGRNQNVGPNHVRLLDCVGLQMEQAQRSPAGSLGSGC